MGGASNCDVPKCSLFDAYLLCDNHTVCWGMKNCIQNDTHHFQNLLADCTCNIQGDMGTPLGYSQNHSGHEQPKANPGK